MNVVRNMLGKSKNLYSSVGAVERDYKLALKHGGGFANKREYYEESLECSDVTSNDKKLLRQWLKR